MKNFKVKKEKLNSKKIEYNHLFMRKGGESFSVTLLVLTIAIMYWQLKNLDIKKEFDPIRSYVFLQFIPISITIVSALAIQFLTYFGYKKQMNALFLKGQDKKETSGVEWNKAQNLFEKADLMAWVSIISFSIEFILIAAQEAL